MSRLAPLLALLTGDPEGGLRAPPPRPPSVITVVPASPYAETAEQRATVLRATRAAANASAAAAATVEALFEAPELRADLAAHCPSIAAIPSAELVRRFAEEAAAAELLSNFQAAPSVHGGAAGSMSLDLLETNGYWPSQWELLFGSATVDDDVSSASRAADDSPEDASKTTTTTTTCNSSYEIGNAAETTLYGFPEFRGADPCFPARFAEAVPRPLYTAVNTMRVDVGNPTFGDVSLVWRRRGFASEAAIVAFADTGLVEFMCNPALEAFVTPRGIAQPNCSVAYVYEADDGAPEGGAVSATPTAGAQTMGTVDGDALHLVPMADAFHNSSAIRWLATHACRLLSEAPWGAERPLFSNETLGYWEAVVAKPAYAVPHVRFVVATFATLFGDDAYGARVRDLCVRNGWVLAWADGAAHQGAAQVLTADVARPMARRFVDPATLPVTSLGPNATAVKVFDDHWRRAAAARADRGEPLGAAWAVLAYADLAAALPVATATLWPLRARDACPDLDDCVGTVGAPDATNRTCLCYAGTVAESDRAAAS